MGIIASAIPIIIPTFQNILTNLCHNMWRLQLAENSIVPAIAVNQKRKELTLYAICLNVGATELTERDLYD